MTGLILQLLTYLLSAHCMLVLLDSNAGYLDCVSMAIACMAGREFGCSVVVRSDM